MLGHFQTREQVGRTMGLPHRPPAPQAAALPPVGGLHWRWRHLSGLATVLGALAAWAQQLPQSRWLQGRGVSGALMGSMAARATALGTVPVPLLVQKFSRLAASSFALFIPVLA